MFLRQSLKNANGGGALRQRVILLAAAKRALRDADVLGEFLLRHAFRQTNFIDRIFCKRFAWSHFVTIMWPNDLFVKMSKVKQ